MWPDNETSEDLLGFKVHADLLVSVVKDDGILPATIGVFGDWGSGKSSLLKMVQEELGKDDQSLVLYFNGWVFEGYDDAKAALLESIIQGFKDNKKFATKAKDQISQLLESINWMRMMGWGLKNVALPAAIAYTTGGAGLIPYLAGQLSKISSDPTKLLENLKSDKAESFIEGIIDKKKGAVHPIAVRKFRQDFRDLISKTGVSRLVVIIDDLDRCTPDRIIENLEAIKLFVNVGKSAFIIGADPRLVRHAIEQRYGGTSEDSRIVDDYLEKLIQVPYHLPKLSDSEIETLISLLICKKELADESFKKVYDSFHNFRSKNSYSVFGLSNIKGILQDEEYSKVTKSFSGLASLILMISESLYGNPRQVKRFLNTLTLKMELARVANIDKFSDSTLAKLMILEYTEPRLFNQLYDWQRIQEGVPNEIAEMEKLCEGKNLQDGKAAVESSAHKGWAKDKVIRWIMVEPSLRSIDLRDYFWLSRDKLTSSISGATLIPPIVRSLFAQLDEELPVTLSQKILKGQMGTFSPNEKESFLKLLSKKLRDNPGNKRYYELFHLMVDEVIEGAVDCYMNETLTYVNPDDFGADIATSMRKYRDTPILGEFLIKYFANKNSESAKAFSLED